MVRNRKRMALYEVIGKARVKPGKAKELEELRPEKGEKAEPAVIEEIVSEPEHLTSWPTKPSKVQFNAGRIEFSVPYQIGIAVGLGVVVLILVFFRLGQIYQRGLSKPVVSEPPRWQTPMKQVRRGPEAAKESVPDSPAVTEKPVLRKSTGSNRIVIQTYGNAEQLRPVQQYFASNGIITEIRRLGSTYLLVTSEKYDNPAKVGTDGFDARERIVELGRLYKPPGPEYESFGPRPFHDAYGMKFSD